MKSKILLVLTVITLSISCVGEDQEFGNTSCYNERLELLGDRGESFRELMDTFCNQCGEENCARSASYTTEYLNLLRSYKIDWRNSGNCTESERVQLESWIDDDTAYWGEFLDNYIACS